MVNCDVVDFVTYYMCYSAFTSHIHRPLTPVTELQNRLMLLQAGIKSLNKEK